MFWKDKVVFLTGASSGIGEALALEMAKRGAILGLLARREELLKEIAAKIEQNGGQARCFAADVTDPEQAREAINRILDRYRRIDVLVHAVGGFEGGAAVSDTAPEAWNRMLDANFLAAVYVLGNVVPSMLRAGSGRIIAVGSRAGVQPAHGAAAYAGSASARCV